MDDRRKAELLALNALGEEIFARNFDPRPSEEIELELIDFMRRAEYRPMGMPLYRPNTWYRARRQRPGEEISDHLEELLYPLRPAKTNGRANGPGDRTFYAAWNQSTALAEVGAETGDRVWITHCRPKKNAEVFGSLIGAYETFFQSGRIHYPVNDQSNFLERFYTGATNPSRWTITYADSLLSRLFRHPGQEKYSATSALARLFFKSEQPTAVLYPSVQANGSFNIAMPDRTFDQCFEVLAVERLDVEFSFGAGILSRSSRWECHDFSRDGRINWYSFNKRHAHSFSMERGLQYSEAIDGWYVPLTWEALKAAAATAA